MHFTPHESGTDASTGPTARVTGLAMMAYRSRAVAAQSSEDLDRLMRAARERNRRMGLTGLLIYDRGCFFQWLEGPPGPLALVWQSISRDPRHVEVEVLGEQPIAKRCFGIWAMRLARRAPDCDDEALPQVAVPSELMRRLSVQATGLTFSAWDHLFAKIVIPRVSATMPGTRPLRSATPFIWHAQRDDGEELAGTLCGDDGDAAAQFVDRLVGQGAQVESLYHEVFEPAARCLGRMLEDDALSDFAVAMTLGRLQVEVRRLRATFAHEERVSPHGHSILVATHPGEPHGLGAAMASELFWIYGWDVNCQFPSTGRNLGELLRQRWYDVLDLTLSNSVRRDQQLHAMRLTIRAARAASLNPSIAVIVEGRSFHESSGAQVYVGADAGFVTVTDAVPVASRLVD